MGDDAILVGFAHGLHIGGFNNTEITVMSGARKRRFAITGIDLFPAWIPRPMTRPSKKRTL